METENWGGEAQWRRHKTRDTKRTKQNKTQHTTRETQNTKRKTRNAKHEPQNMKHKT